MYLNGLVGLLRALGPTAPGDLLCFEPTSLGTARVELLKATAQAAERQQQQTEQQPASSGGISAGALSSGSSAMDAEPPEWQPEGSESAASGSSGSSELEAELSDDESDADSGGSWGRPAKRQRQQLAAAPPGSSRGGGAPSNWSGLEPADSGSYALTVPPSAFKPSGSRKLHVPGG